MDVRNDMLRRGVIVRSINDVLAMCPPLVISDDEIGRIVDTMAESLRAVACRTSKPLAWNTPWRG